MTTHLSVQNGTRSCFGSAFLGTSSEAVDIWDEFTLEFADHFSVEIRGLDTPEVGVSKNDWDFRGRMVEVSGFWLRSGFKSQRDSLDISGYIEQAMFCWLKGTGTVMATLRPKDARGLRDVPIEMLSCIGGFFSPSVARCPGMRKTWLCRVQPVPSRLVQLTWHLSSHELIDFSKSYGSKSCK